ncbi:DUF397 domain-containing protein [Streptomyces sp. NBC_00237]|uniref:DUF397 domain-containing protein n=1 Tax=Streptomyces sp. NBC_00237 TaxID=2975687 RepID=UPI002257C0C1|nr:DUF397 domain-containing protein [Streptomyces sp. NBC_00237]MCX5201467.1 DUF397 domain-containing protein [Streptomyces sp. NBC_00237]
MNAKPAAPLWVKSSYSGPEGGNCLEWAPEAIRGGLVPIRDSKVPAGPTLNVSDAGWGVFVDALKTGSL